MVCGSGGFAVEDVGAGRLEHARASRPHSTGMTGSSEPCATATG